jgi:hypothetical protein
MDDPRGAALPAAWNRLIVVPWWSWIEVSVGQRRFHRHAAHAGRFRLRGVVSETELWMVQPAVVEGGGVDEVVDAFREYTRVEWRLAPLTVHDRAGVVRRFLVGQAGPVGLDLGGLGRAEVPRYIVTEAARLKSGRSRRGRRVASIPQVSVRHAYPQAHPGRRRRRPAPRPGPRSTWIITSLRFTGASLHRKLEAHGSRMIQTVRSSGYVLRPNPMAGG